METNNLPSINDSLSLSKLELLGNFVPGLNEFLAREMLKTYDDFIDILYKDIDQIISKKQENPEIYHKDSEDRTTIDIIFFLCQWGYVASHDTQVGGHTDILVRKNNYIWIGEAKIYSGFASIWQGFKQLTTRYSIGDYNQKDGGLFIYINNHPDATSVMEEWKKDLSAQGLKDYKHYPCPIRPLNFFSTHKHEKSGQPFKVRHIPVMLYFAPQDRKGKKNQKI